MYLTGTLSKHSFYVFHHPDEHRHGLIHGAFLSIDGIVFLINRIWSYVENVIVFLADRLHKITVQSKRDKSEQAIKINTNL